MNPPFARSQERGNNGQTAKRHLRSAMRLCAPGGRAVAILPDGFDAQAFAEDQDQASLQFDIRLAGAYSRSGTGIAVRVVVIDRSAAADQATITADISDLAELHSCLGALPDHALTQANIHRLKVRSIAKPTIGTVSSKPVAPFAARNAEPTSAASLSYEALEEPAPVPKQVGIYLPYRPSRVAIPDAPVHPTPLVESVAMGSVAAPVPKARPSLPANWQSDKLLSAAQCETLIYACEAFTRDLPGQFRPSQQGTTLELAEDGHSYRQGFSSATVRARGRVDKSRA